MTDTKQSKGAQMTDRTHPDSVRIITSGDVIAELHDRIAELEQEVAHTDSLLGKANALARIRAHRIAELEAELEAVGAGGVQALAASAPVAPTQPDLRSDVLCDMSYRAGLKHGFNLGVEEDSAGLQKALDSRAEALKVSRTPEAATVAPAPQPAKDHQDAEDAARYRLLLSGELRVHYRVFKRKTWFSVGPAFTNYERDFEQSLSAAIDAARAQQKGGEPA